MAAMTRSRHTFVPAILVGALVALAACTSPPEPSAPTPPRADSGPAITSTPLGAKWVWAQFDEVKPYLDEVGAGHTYVEVVLCDVQKSQGVFDWSVPDSFVTRARAVGFTSLVKLRTGRCWATPGSPKHHRGNNVTESALPKDMGVYTDFVERAVRRYTDLGVSEFAIENEVNSPSFWDGTPQDYAVLARAGGKAVRAANPAAQVVDGSVSSAATGYAVAEGLLSEGKDTEAVATYQAYYQRRFGTRGGAAAINEVSSTAELRTELARPGPASAVAFMGVIDGLFAEGVFQTRQVHFYENWQALPATLAHIRAHTPGAIPLEIWELGIWHDDRTVPEDQRTAEVVRATVIALAAGVTKVLWLPLLDNPTGRLGETLYGLVAPAGGARGASSAYALISKAAADGASVSPVTKEGLAGATFGSTPPTMVVWSTGGQVTLPTGSGTSGTTLDGDTTTSTAARAVTTVTSQPVLITTDGPLSALQEMAR